MRRLLVPALLVPLLAGPLPAGPAQAGYEAGVAAWERYDYQTAYRELLPLAERGDRSAQFYIGHMFYYGEGVPADYAKAMEWFRKSAEKGDADAQGYVGDLYYFGRGVPQSFAEAARWYRRAAKQGNAYGKLSLGLLYTNGEGVPQDHAEAVKLFRELAERGDPDGQRNLAIAYENGEGVPKSETEALAWYRKAADQNDPYAFMHLGRLYEEGIGVARDILVAYAWWNLAAARLKPGADLDYAVQRRDELGGQLTTARLNEAQRLAMDWQPGRALERTRHRTGRGAPPMNQASGRGGEPDARREVESTGSGFFVGPHGELVTAQHVVEDCAAIQVTPATSGLTQPAALIAEDVTNDLALLRLDVADTAYASFRGAPLRAGESVMVVGYPLAGILAPEVGVASGIVSALAGQDNDSRLLQLTAPVQSGNSGGPLVDMSGHVAGVVNSKLDALALAESTGDLPQNVNFAVKHTLAQSFLEANGVTVSVGEASPMADPADVAERARSFTAFIECMN